MRTIYFFIIEFLFLSFGIDVYSTNLSKGDIVVLTDFPYYLRNDIKISFTADVTTMGTFYIGRGYRSASGIYVKIDGTKITPITCDLSGNEIEKASIVNDLAISTFIKVILDVRHTTKYQYKCNLEIQSDNGKKIVELSENWSGVEDPVFVKAQLPTVLYVPTYLCVLQVLILISQYGLLEIVICLFTILKDGLTILKNVDIIII